MNGGRSRALQFVLEGLGVDLACWPQLGEKNPQMFNNMNAPLAQWLERWSYEP